MRKLWMALGGAVLVALTAAGVASAVNTYQVDVAATTPTEKGSLTKPVPAKFKFGFEVGDTEGLRPFVISQYRIVDEGGKFYAGARPSCTFDQATDPQVTDPDDLKACKKAKVGEGAIDNDAGAPNDRTQKVDCDVKLTLFNIRTGDPRDKKTVSQIKKEGGVAIRIDTYLPEASRCPIPVHEALAAPFYDVKVDGIQSTELRFKVPDTLAHPGGLDNALTDVTTTVQKKTGRDEVKGGDERKVGFFSLVGRKGKKRTTRVTFVDESGDKQTATKQD